MSGMKIRDRSLAAAFNKVMENHDNKLNGDEVASLLKAANDGRGLTSLEKNELQWILFKHQNEFDTDARTKLSNALGVSPQGPVSQPSFYLRDSGLRRTMSSVLNMENISKADVEKLLDSAKDGGRITNRERGELTMILNRAGDSMDADGRAALADALGITLPTPTPDPTPATPPKPVSELSKGARDIDTIDGFGDKFRSDLESVRKELVDHPDLSDSHKAKRMFDFFKPYGEKFHKLSQSEGGAKVKAELEKVNATLKDVGFDALTAADEDKDGLTAATEIMKGTDPNRYSMVADHKTWTTTYWPMAGKTGDTDGNAKTHLWAKDGALAKFDTMLRNRGDDTGAKALEFERKPALNWLIGESDKGHYIPNATLKETDAERTTGVDFDGDGQITAGVKADFLNSQGNFAGVSNRDQLVPKLGDETLTRKMETANGETTLRYFHADGREVSEADRKKIVLTNPNSDGKVDDTMSVGWWGSCDKVALAGILFEAPKRDVEVDGVKFTKQDILGLLTVIADSQASGTDFRGSRYDDRPDILVTKDGRQISGELVNDGDVEFRTSDMWRWNGDYMVLNGTDKEISFKNFETGKLEVFKADDIKYLAREDKKDMSASEFNKTLEDWLGKGQSAAMDRDSGDHVWNYNFWKAERAETDAPRGTNVSELRGFNGEVKNADNLKFFETDVYFGESDWPRNYRYWIETDANGKEINSGWFNDNPDFLWKPEGFKNFTGYNERNPFVKPELVKEIYLKSIE